ncbi:MAG: hypothetical protein IBJ11_06400 [Phycisphaerales bacterium]|nr:hypothetical protein [Phycisphaerales bacterium]
MGIGKTATRILVIGGLATGAAVIVAGPARIHALATQTRERVQNAIDKHIDDPVALRQQLRELETKYPERISAVRGELAELQAQIRQLEREKSVSQKVVEMASADLQQLKGQLDKAETARTGSPTAVIYVRHDSAEVPLDQAYSNATRLNNTVIAHQSRVADAERDLAFLGQQAQRLSELLSNLESERAQFQAQIWQLDGQVEMIARNDRLIELVESRQKAIDKFSQFDAVSLDQVTGRMAKIRAEQEARLQALAGDAKTKDYETKAKAMLDAESAARSIFQKSQDLSPAGGPEKIRILEDGSVKPGTPAGVKIGPVVDATSKVVIR